MAVVTHVRLAEAPAGTPGIQSAFIYALFHCRGSVAKVVAGSAKELQTFTSVTNQPDRLDVASNFQGL